MRRPSLLLAVVAMAAVLTAMIAGLSTGAGAGNAERASAAPWAPDQHSLARRVAALRLPAQSDTAFHIHAWLHVFVDGQPVTVPAGLGIDPTTGFLAPLHTHDASGIIHLESARPYPFTLGQFFAIWGVRFGCSALGAYPRPSVWVNGRPVVDGPHYVLHAHDSVLIAVGPRGSFPTTVPARFPPGL